MREKSAGAPAAVELECLGYGRIRALAEELGNLGRVGGWKERLGGGCGGSPRSRFLFKPEKRLFTNMCSNKRLARPDWIVCAGRVKCWETKRPALQRRFQLPILAAGPQRPEGLEQTGHLRGGEGFSFSTRVGCVRLSEHAGRIFPWLAARGLYSNF